MSIESVDQLRGMERVGHVVTRVLDEVCGRVCVGARTCDVEQVAGARMRFHGARSAPQLEYDAPSAIFVSVNDAAVHGLPDRRRLVAGDVVAIDVTLELDGYVADAARTVVVAPAPSERLALVSAACAGLRAGLRAARAGRPVNAIGAAIETTVNARGFHIVRELTGHGVGRAIHEPPTVPSYHETSQTDVLTPGLVIAIEPIVSTTDTSAVMDADDWTIRTADGAPTAHVEHTIVVTEHSPILIAA